MPLLFYLFGWLTFCVSGQIGSESCGLNRSSLRDATARKYPPYQPPGRRPTCQSPWSPGAPWAQVPVPRRRKEPARGEARQQPPRPHSRDPGIGRRWQGCLPAPSRSRRRRRGSPLPGEGNHLPLHPPPRRRVRRYCCKGPSRRRNRPGAFPVVQQRSRE